MGGGALGNDFLLRCLKAAARIKFIVEHRRAREQTCYQAVATARIAVVAGVVGAETKQGVIVTAKLERNAARQYVLVVIFVAGGAILAKAVARQARDRCADAEQFVDRIGSGGDSIHLAEGADGAAQVEHRAIGQAAGDIFDRAANRVAAVERALWPAQHFDPFDVINVEHRSLGAVEIDVVEVQADALFKPGDRILLADAANEGGQGRVGSARGFDGDVWRGIADVGDVDRALALERGTGEYRDRDRDVLERFLAAPGGDDDFAIIFAGHDGVGLRFDGRVSVGLSGGLR